MVYQRNQLVPRIITFKRKRREPCLSLGTCSTLLIYRLTVIAKHKMYICLVLFLSTILLYFVISKYINRRESLELIFIKTPNQFYKRKTHLIRKMHVDQFKSLLHLVREHHLFQTNVVLSSCNFFTEFM